MCNAEVRRSTTGHSEEVCLVLPHKHADTVCCRALQLMDFPFLLPTVLLCVVVLGCSRWEALRWLVKGSETQHMHIQL